MRIGDQLLYSTHICVAFVILLFSHIFLIYTISQKGQRLECCVCHAELLNEKWDINQINNALSLIIFVFFNELSLHKTKPSSFRSASQTSKRTLSPHLFIHALCSITFQFTFLQIS